MELTVRIILRTREGIIVVQEPKSSQIELPGGRRREGEQTWKVTAARILRDKTGVLAHDHEIFLLHEAINRPKSGLRYRLIYSEARIPDYRILTHLISVGKGREKVSEVLYDEGRESRQFNHNHRRFLVRNKLFKPPGT